jgi:hypothetical protein
MMSKLAEVQTMPRIIDEIALSHLAAYLITTQEVGITFLPAPKDSIPDHSRPIPSFAMADADFNSGMDGKARLGGSQYHGEMPTKEQILKHKISGPFQAKSNKEQGPPSLSASGAELKAAVRETGCIIVTRHMSEEIAGIADRQTTEDRPLGAAEATTLNAKQSNDAVKEYIKGPPTPLAQDNASLVIVASQDASKKARQLRPMARAIRYLRTSMQEGLINITQVKAEDQWANGLTKCHVSMTVHWKEMEFLQGSQPAVQWGQDQAASYAKMKKSPTQMGERLEPTNKIVYPDNQPADERGR